MKKKAIIVYSVIVLCLVLLFIFIKIGPKSTHENPLSNNTCIIRVNNYGKVRACEAGNSECSIWEKTLQTGSPGHTEQPNRGDVIAVNVNDTCEVAYNCSKCSTLKQTFGEFCPTHMTGTSAWICGMYVKCNC